MTQDARRTAETAARVSYGRLVAMLSARSRDISASEDALSEAFVSALRTWPENGVPDNPDAWLLTAARNMLKNAYRKSNMADAAREEIVRRIEARQEQDETFPDERLKLLFVCAHPAIHEDVRTPLMLQTVLGLDAARIAGAFLVSPATMGQRLVRAKAKIKSAGIKFELPDPADLANRLDDVLCAIYAAFGVAWDAVPGSDDGATALSAEAIFLGRLVVSLLPSEPEAAGLLALMLYCDARKHARHAPDGRFVPLAAQDARLWSREQIIEAEGLLTAAAAHRRFGRFQCEAAIQSVHVQTPITGKTNHEALRLLYRMLVDCQPSIGAYVGYAAVLIECGAALEARGVLESLDSNAVAKYQPYWVAKAAVLEALGDGAGANLCRTTAIGLTESAAIRAFLLSKLE
jgi:RNA polymerase sigma-70 factor, ECF subfamily